jgi:hypothetical protein
MKQRELNRTDRGRAPKVIQVQEVQSTGTNISRATKTLLVNKKVLCEQSNEFVFRMVEDMKLKCKALSQGLIIAACHVLVV